MQLLTQKIIWAEGPPPPPIGWKTVPRIGDAPVERGGWLTPPMPPIPPPMPIPSMFASIPPRSVCGLKKLYEPPCPLAIGGSGAIAGGFGAPPRHVCAGDSFGEEPSRGVPDPLPFHL